MKESRYGIFKKANEVSAYYDFFSCYHSFRAIRTELRQKYRPKAGRNLHDTIKNCLWRLWTLRFNSILQSKIKVIVMKIHNDDFFIF